MGLRDAIDVVAIKNVGFPFWCGSPSKISTFCSSLRWFLAPPESVMGDRVIGHDYAR
jgi:hypothetical protein